MITDRETNAVYFSDLLLDLLPREFLSPIYLKLEAEGIGVGFLHSTKDIWCRDYMPVQVSGHRFVQFKYDPGYLHYSNKDNATITDAADACRDIGIQPELSTIRIDGGNIVKSRTKVIMTDRVFKENPDCRSLLTRELKELLDVGQVIIVPQCPDDPFGHADGMIRFLDGVRDENTVLVNDFPDEYPDFKQQLHSALRKAGLKTILVPYAPEAEDDAYDATGIYINYLQVGELVLYPEYGIEADELADKFFRKYFGEHVFPARANAIAKKGGVLNCATWNIKK